DWERVMPVIIALQENARKQNVKIESIGVIEDVAALHASSAFLQASDIKASTVGLGWSIGGQFYASQSLKQEEIKIGVNVVSVPEIFAGALVDYFEKHG